MKRTYSTYDAKAKFSELMRTVRSGKRVRITYHGRPIAEVIPIEEEPETLAARLDALEKRGVLARPAARPEYRTLRERRGALKRFLAERD